MSSPWWRGAVLYEIYVRSFADANGDGVGDLAGVRARLPYVRDLGVDGIWLTPFYPSPGADHGYDVADYFDVDPLFGTLTELDALLDDAHRLGLRVVIDLVANHTSIEHRWFRDHPDYYVWAEQPNNWLSVFGGSAWTYDDRRGLYYLHLFAREQPDLDWHNPDVPREFEGIIRFWLDRGIDGLRIDVAHALFKDPELADEPEPVPGAEPRSFDRRRAIDRPELHPLYRRWRPLADAYPDDRVLVGEVFLSDPSRVADYVRPDELHLAFNFTLLWQPWHAEAIRDAIEQTRSALEQVGATPTWVLENHDVVRLPTRYGGGAEGRRRARAAALLLLALPGTQFVYAGQELGLDEVELSDDVRRDPVFRFTGGARIGRDGCRVPIPWESEPPGFGFTSGRPWLPMPASWAQLSVAEQHASPDSTLALYRRALAIRRASPALQGTAFEWDEAASGSLTFARTSLDERIVCAVNVSAESFPLPSGDVLVASEAGIRDQLPPGSAVWVRVEQPVEPAPG